MKPDGFTQKQDSLWKWKREPKSSASVIIKNHIHIINVISNCAIHSEYAKLQGKKLISEKDIIISLKCPTTIFYPEASILEALLRSLHLSNF